VDNLLDRTPQTYADLEEARRKFAAEAEAEAAKYWDALKKGEQIGA
jgi:hypothetical protein